MTQPIIDPMWFYWMQVCGGLKTFLTVAGITGVIATSIVSAFMAENISTEKALNFLKIWFPVSIVIVILSIFVPSQDTFMKMMIAQNVTPQNITNVKDFTVDTVSEIVEAIDKGIEKAKQ